MAFLTSFPQTSTSIRNRYGETPGDVVGRNAKTSTGLKERITELLQGGCQSCAPPISQASLFSVRLQGVYVSGGKVLLVSGLL